MEEHGETGTQKAPTIERRLFLAHRNAPRPKPKEKEIQEALAFFQKTDKLLFPKRRRRHMVIDVAGSHGLLGLLHLVFHRSRDAVILDPHRPPSFDTMLSAWGPFIPDDATIRYIESPLDTALPALLEENDDAVAVACHACQHLSAEVVRIAIASSRDFAVMPCCHKDLSGEVKHAAAAAEVPLGVAMDLCMLGAIQATPRYRGSLRTIDARITPQNRVVVGTRRDVDPAQAQAGQV